jgi:hypothetical protein
VANHLKAAGLPTELHEIPGDLRRPDRPDGLMRQDKKVWRAS